jgi:hypothetical protein
MTMWREALRDGVASGTWAAALSTIVLAACGRVEEGNAAGPVSTPSKWVLGDHAAHRPCPSPGQTVLGHVIHTGATILWAVAFERWRRAQPAPQALPVVLRGAAVTAAAACVGDYVVAPQRFTPGFERRLSTGALFLTYASIAGALAVWRVRARPAPAAAAVFKASARP